MYLSKAHGCKAAVTLISYGLQAEEKSERSSQKKLRNLVDGRGGLLEQVETTAGASDDDAGTGEAAKAEYEPSNTNSEYSDKRLRAT